MRILCVCANGNNRSVHFAHMLKYWGNDVLTCGIKTNALGTVMMLCSWAELIIKTTSDADVIIPAQYNDKVLLLDVGPDNYHRPFNRELIAKVKQYLEDNKQLLKNL